MLFLPYVLLLALEGNTLEVFVECSLGQCKTVSFCSVLEHYPEETEFFLALILFFQLRIKSKNSAH